jgi:hypothetical protein
MAKTEKDDANEWHVTLFGDDEKDTFEMLVSPAGLDRLQKFGIVRSEDVHEHADPVGMTPYKYAYGDLHAYDALQEHLEAVSR